MTNYELQQRLAFLQKTLKKLKELKSQSFDEFSGDFKISDAALYNLVVVIETIADLANQVIAQKGGVISGNQSEAFRVLGTLGVVDKTMEMGLVRLARLRNTRAHSYVDVNLQELYMLLRNELPTVEKVSKILGRELGMEEKR